MELVAALEIIVLASEAVAVVLCWHDRLVDGCVILLFCLLPLAQRILLVGLFDGSIFPWGFQWGARIVGIYRLDHANLQQLSF
jgi:hypothetical protein